MHEPEELQRAERGFAHTFIVRATDPAGNADASPALYAWTVTGAGTPPPTDDKPVAAFVDSPARWSPAGWSRSTPRARRAPTHPAPTPGSTTATMARPAASGRWAAAGSCRFTFQGVGIKYVRLTVTDADGDKATILKQVSVAQS